uniref:Uncharacterized protein MANES_07G130200 n=1 Tax=Rhizophora mucronata TaxID=61149 RepID=A0A2P2JIF5_RHIMU
MRVELIDLGSESAKETRATSAIVFKDLFHSSGT